MTLDQTIDALIFLQAEMRRRKLRTDILCGFYGDNTRDTIHVTLQQADVDRMMADPSRFIALDPAYIGIPLQDAIAGERK
jgi:hypothetical protein